MEKLLGIATVDNARAVRFLDADKGVADVAYEEFSRGRRPDYEDVTRVHLMAGTWAECENLAPEIRAELRSLARRTLAVLRHGV